MLRSARIAPELREDVKTCQIMPEMQSVKSSQPKVKGLAITWIQGAFLFAIWLLLSGKFDLFHMATGVLAVFFVLWLDRNLGPANLGKNDLPIRVHPIRALLYLPWLGWQMLLAAFGVARVVLSPRMPLNPQLVGFTTEQPHTIARVLLGNSITLTPGTLTLDIEGNRYFVHALSDESREGLLGGGMQKKVARLFLAEDSTPVSKIEIGRNQHQVRIRG